VDSIERYWESLHVGQSRLAGVGYEGFGQAFNAWMYRVRRPVFLKTVAPFLEGRTDLEVLDIGSGTGFYLDRWRELGVRRVTASDFSEAAVARLRESYADRSALKVDIGGEPAELPPVQYDAVSIVDVLFHIVDDGRYRRAFDNLGRLVRPGGLLVFSENFLRGARRRVEPVQVSRSLNEIESLLASSGFQPLIRRRMFVLMNAPVDSSSRLHMGVWKVLAKSITLQNWTGAVVGPLLYPLERALVAPSREGPSTELMVCRKAPS
jgi:SAM-dependent methyltransferase